MAKSLADLEKKDPEFFKYLKENDAGLLDFEAEVEKPAKKSKKAKKAVEVEVQEEEDEVMEFDGAASDDEDAAEPEFNEEDKASKEPEKTAVTMDMLRAWQSAMIEVSPNRFFDSFLPCFRG